jgi:hypothetical protein
MAAAGHATSYLHNYDRVLRDFVKESIKPAGRKRNDMRMSKHLLVHANVAQMRAPLGDPRMADFIAQVDAIDALAKASPGFVALPTPPDEGEVYSEPQLLNLSLWQSVESLEQFTYGGKHARALARRAEWFEQHPGPNYVLFWIPNGEIPSEAEVKRRIEHLASHGPTPYAFTFERPFTVQDMLDAVA